MSEILFILPGEELITITADQIKGENFKALLKECDGNLINLSNFNKQTTDYVFGTEFKPNKSTINKKYDISGLSPEIIAEVIKLSILMNIKVNVASIQHNLTQKKKKKFFLFYLNLNRK
jgi:hypothetical protein